MKKYVLSVLFAIVLICTLFASCKDETQCSEHAWQDWNTLKNATCTECGTERRVCVECGETEDKDIPMVTHINNAGSCSVCFQAIYRWFDADGSLLYEEVTRDQATQYELPSDNEKWDYIEWRSQGINEYHAYRIPQNAYFVGNVFQIVVKDLETPMTFGSAFVFNSDGWFITNAHVMENAYSAQAIFNIPNEATGESFTYLDINEGSYYHRDKDIYVGKIENYDLIKSYYKDISISSSYEIGDLTYSVGYPSASTLLQINKGFGVMENTTLYDKLYSGNSYIFSTSYIAPGSSGGILVNDDLEVIGITTLGLTDADENFIVGGAISAFNFKNLIFNPNSSDLITLEERFYGDCTEYISLFNQAKADYSIGTAARYVRDDGTPYYQYGWFDEGVNTDGTAYTYEEYLFVCSDGLMQYTTDYYWADGSRRTINFYGYYSDTFEFSSFIYEFHFEWETGAYYEIYCDNINYSSTVSLTLKNAVISDKSYGYTVTENNITYAKEQFNYMFEDLSDYMSKYE